MIKKYISILSFMLILSNLSAQHEIYVGLKFMRNYQSNYFNDSGNWFNKRGIFVTNSFSFNLGSKLYKKMFIEAGIHKLKYNFGCIIEQENAMFYFHSSQAMESIQFPVLLKYKRKIYKKMNMNFGFGPVIGINRTYGQLYGSGNGFYKDSSLKLLSEFDEIKDFNKFFYLLNFCFGLEMKLGNSTIGLDLNINKGFDKIVEQNSKYNVNDSQDWNKLSTYIKGNYFYWGIAYQYYFNL